MSVMLTTNDNPFNPHTQYDEWYAFDTAMGYNTCSYLARIVKTSNDLSDSDAEMANRAGMEEIIEMNPSGFYVIISSEN